MVPLFGDMHISLMSYVQMCPHWDESKWMAGTESADARVVEEEYVITAKLPAFRQQRNDLNANLALINAKVGRSRHAHAVCADLVAMLTPRLHAFVGPGDDCQHERQVAVRPSA